MPAKQRSKRVEPKQEWSWKTGSPDKEARMEAYLEWLLTPSSERVPATKAALADALGVSTQTLRNYAKDPWLQRELVQRGRAIARVERAQDVLDTLFEQATDPENPRSVAAAKAYLDWINRQIEPSLPTDIADMTDEELVDLLQHLSAPQASE